MFIYKVCTETLWSDAARAGAFKGAPVDLADGYIHFSTQEQLGETLKRHFGGQSGLVLIEIEAARLGDKLKWEPSRGGALFPHLYGDLDPAIVRKVEKLKLGAEGHQIPPLPL
jgi:uncharacterized protein (DUF952 family)